MKAWLTLLIGTASLAFANASHGQAILDQIDEALHVETKNGWFRSDFSGTLDLEGYYIDQRPPGLLFPDDNHYFNPRLSLFLDTHFGQQFYSFVQFRADRGFDPGAADSAARFDEYLLRYKPFDEPWVNLQVGKFATVFGDWVNRHESWNNPFITAPVAYENVLTITDQTVPATPAGFLARKNTFDAKAAWLPILWGPAYTSGAAIFGRVHQFDYALDFKNASISSRPTIWDARHLGWEHPTWSGRLGWRPNAAWKLGVSASYGPYLLPVAETVLPAGKTLDDYAQTSIAYDVSYAWRDWQFWGEVVFSRFDVPNVGNADTSAYFIESKYKLTTKAFAALRWNQQFFDPVQNGAGGEEDWDNDMWRIDAAFGYRLTRHLQGKLQYSYSHQKGNHQQGEQLVAVQATLKF
ncbi:MAG TPA: hypothetical protein VGH19_09555 [Verrucomicrobiae bacterium]